MKKHLLATTVLLGIFSCGDDGATPIDAPIDGNPPDCTATCSSIDAAIDAPTAIDAAVDAPPSTVVVVACPTSAGEIASDVSAPTFAFTVTDSSINTNDIVRFTMPGNHSVRSGVPPTTDGAYTVGFNQIVCLKFTAPGSYPFFCNPHQFTAALTVTDPD